MRIAICLIRIYTPFICTLMALVNGVLFKMGLYTLPEVYLLATLTGNSILVDLFMFAASLKMCIWYKLNLFFLLLIQICGLLYTYLDIDRVLYIWVTILLASLGVICFLIFKIFYRVASVCKLTDIDKHQ